ncbi:uncharacterized protein LOC110030758 isoform X2 [Phalaenopsis equestris]|uniref:uncharacterized protein LOC110030758 isoform X2 n=1 Tax=Phalaenopsis equestris TaxID=78828 RepID=UPI0009E53E88|nr:uncharacterized protein LOC110030758 isoform X2 [Phalaenopsis equestris]
MMAAATGASGGTTTGISGVSQNYLSCKATGPKYWICYNNGLRKSYHLRHNSSELEKRSFKYGWLELVKFSPSSMKARRNVPFILLATSDDGVAVNGTPQRSHASDAEDVRFKSDQSLQGKNLSSVLVQSLHDAARAIELAFLEHSSSSKSAWFSKTWLGVDKSAWVKVLSYQAAVHSLLQGTKEISSRGDGRDRDINLLVHRSLTRLCAPLESIIYEELSAKQPSTSEWFWSHQHPMVVNTFVNILERDPCFTAATKLCSTGKTSGSATKNDLTLLKLALSCLAAVTKLGSAKISCSQFLSLLPDATGRLMDALLDFLPIQKAYDSMKEIGLRREFLFHFGPRAASVKYKGERTVEEISFWINLLQKQLQLVISRERIWAKLTTCESIEVLEKDLAIFGFFIALGRSSQSFLSSNGFTTMENPIEGIIRYLIGGSVLFYPQLSSISSYQLYVEVVCEELEWFPFYGGNLSNTKQIHDNMVIQEKMPQEEAIPYVLDVCSYWMTGFIKYSSWLENPSNIKAARFLARGHSFLTEHMRELGVLRNRRDKDGLGHQNQRQTEVLAVEKEMDTFDKTLESVEEVLVRLENLLQELHVSSSNNGKEHLKAACSDLEKIRKLKKEAEFLEASFRAKADSLEQGGAGDDSHSFTEKSFPEMAMEASISSKKDEVSGKRMANKERWFWNFMTRNVSKRERPIATSDQNVVASSKFGNDETISNERNRFEHLRNELIELERRVQQSTDNAQNVELLNSNSSCSGAVNTVIETELAVDEYVPTSDKRNDKLAPLQKKDGGLAKSLQKIKEASVDVWQGTQLLAIDVVAAMVLLKRTITGDDLTEKEKKALRRTLTDLASVVPIGFLMLLPVTAVGHAAMLAAIQRYVPSLIPSTYARERLDLLRQLEKVKELDTYDGRSEDGKHAVSSTSSNPE